jgi:hypothetical protein
MLDHVKDGLTDGRSIERKLVVVVSHFTLSHPANDNNAN